MNKHAIAELSAELILKYYNNDYMPFLERFDDECLWYGPAEGQYIKGRDVMINTWHKEKHNLTFTVGNMKTEVAAVDNTSCNVILTYSVITHYPDGNDIYLNQRVLLCWHEKLIHLEDGSKQHDPRILVCFISNPHPKHDDDFVYPVNFQEVYATKGLTPSSAERIHFRGVDKNDYYVLFDSIMWIETKNNGLRSVIHTNDESIKTTSRVTDIINQYPHLFLRCHQSFLVNPNYIQNIHRFSVVLNDGTSLPIPEKKYTAFKKQVADYNKKKK